MPWGRTPDGACFLNVRGVVRFWGCGSLYVTHETCTAAARRSLIVAAIGDTMNLW